jgi:hypothetical protein
MSLGTDPCTNNKKVRTVKIKVAGPKIVADRIGRQHGLHA